MLCNSLLQCRFVIELLSAVQLFDVFDYQNNCCKHDLEEFKSNIQVINFV